MRQAPGLCVAEIQTVLVRNVAIYWLLDAIVDHVILRKKLSEILFSFLGVSPICPLSYASWHTIADWKWPVWMQRFISAGTHLMSPNHSR